MDKKLWVSDFTITLAFDVAKSREENAFSDFADQVSRRMGFIPIPISVMLIHSISQSVDFTSNLATTAIGKCFCCFRRILKDVVFDSELY